MHNGCIISGIFLRQWHCLQLVKLFTGGTLVGFRGITREGCHFHPRLLIGRVCNVEVDATRRKTTIARRQALNGKYVRTLVLKVGLREHFLQQHNIVEML